MAAVDIVAPTHTAHIEFAVSCSPIRADGFPASFKERHSLRDHFNTKHAQRPRTLSLSAAPLTPRATPPPSPAPDTLDLFPGLPPLLAGRADTHLRAGVMAAAHKASRGEADAERAFFVADLSAVHAQHLRWRRALPDIEPFYAVKCNPDPYVLRLLAALGTGFDCASNGEITQVLELGVNPDRIIFANPCKPTSFVRAAQRNNVRLMTFDNTDELHKIARTFPRAQLVLRILTDDSAALCQLGLKFGASLGAVPGLLALAKKLELDVVGISFHVGSGSQDTHAFADAIQRARRAFDMGTEAGYDFKLLDVGGGFEHTPDFELRAGVLRDAIALEFPDRRQRGIRVIAEPGRFYVANAFCLAACVIARRAPIADAQIQTTGQGASEEGKPKTMCMLLFLSIVSRMCSKLTLCIQITSMTACTAPSTAFSSTTSTSHRTFYPWAAPSTSQPRLRLDLRACGDRHATASIVSRPRRFSRRRSRSETGCGSRRWARTPSARRAASTGSKCRRWCIPLARVARRGRYAAPSPRRRVLRGLQMPEASVTSSLRASLSVLKV
jgi:diaminopimelate decarboxylase